MYNKKQAISNYKTSVNSSYYKKYIKPLESTLYMYTLLKNKILLLNEKKFKPFQIDIQKDFNTRIFNTFIDAYFHIKPYIEFRSIFNEKIFLKEINEAEIIESVNRLNLILINQDILARHIGNFSFLEKIIYFSAPYVIDNFEELNHIIREYVKILEIIVYLSNHNLNFRDRSFNVFYYFNSNLSLRNSLIKNLKKIKEIDERNIYYDSVIISNYKVFYKYKNFFNEIINYVINL